VKYSTVINHRLNENSSLRFFLLFLLKLFPRLFNSLFYDFTPRKAKEKKVFFIFRAKRPFDETTECLVRTKLAWMKEKHTAHNLMMMMTLQYMEEATPTLNFKPIGAENGEFF
jgi:hypothetical protein